MPAYAMTCADTGISIGEFEAADEDEALDKCCAAPNYLAHCAAQIKAGRTALIRVQMIDNDRKPVV